MAVNQLVPQNLHELPPGNPVPESLLYIEQPDGTVNSILFSQITGFAPNLTDFMLKSVYDPTNSGVVANAQNLNGNPPSYYLDLSNATNLLNMNKVSGLVAALADKIDFSFIGVPDGICPLNGSGTIDPSYLPFSGLSYLGTWDANTNTPTISDGTGSLGDWYKCSVGGTQDLGSGNITFSVGDWVIHNGTAWEKNADASSVSSVNGQTGAVVLNTSHISPSTDRRYVNDNVNNALAAAEAAGLNSTNRRFALLNEVQASISVIPGILSPEAFGATHSTDTFADRGFNQAYIDANYAGIGAVTTDTIDWAAIQKCLYLAGSQDAVIMFSPYTYRVNKPLVFPLYPKHIKVIGNMATIETVNNASYAIFGQPVPSNQTIADTIISSAKIDIDSLSIKGGSNQKGIYLNCLYNAILRNNYVYNCNTGIEGRFLLRLTADNNFVYNNTYGMRFNAGNWSGATGANSSMHMASLRDNTVKMFSDSETGIEVSASEGFQIESTIIEGVTCKRGIDLNTTITTTHDSYIYNTYMECTSGISEALIYYRTAGGILEIKGVKAYHSSFVLVDAASTSGIGEVELARVKSAASTSGKYFKNNGIWWTFRADYNFFNPATPIQTYRAMFHDSTFGGIVPDYYEDLISGTVRSIAPMYNTGSNKFQIVR